MAASVFEGRSSAATYSTAVCPFWSAYLASAPFSISITAAASRCSIRSATRSRAPRDLRRLARVGRDLLRSRAAAVRPRPRRRRLRRRRRRRRRRRGRRRRRRRGARGGGGVRDERGGGGGGEGSAELQQVWLLAAHALRAHQIGARGPKPTFATFDVSTPLLANLFADRLRKRDAQTIALSRRRRHRPRRGAARATAARRRRRRRRRCRRPPSARGVARHRMRRRSSAGACSRVGELLKRWRWLMPRCPTPSRRWRRRAAAATRSSTAARGGAPHRDCRRRRRRRRRRDRR